MRRGGRKNHRPDIIARRGKDFPTGEPAAWARRGTGPRAGRPPHGPAEKTNNTWGVTQPGAQAVRRAGPGHKTSYRMGSHGAQLRRESGWNTGAQNGLRRCAARRERNAAEHSPVVRVSRARSQGENARAASRRPARRIPKNMFLTDARTSSPPPRLVFRGGGRLSAALPAPPPPRFPCPAAARPTGSRRPPLGIKGKETYLTGETLPAVSGARKKNSAPPCFPREAVVLRSYCDAAPYHIRRIFCADPG